MSMEEVSMLEDDIIRLRKALEAIQNYARTAPLDLLKAKEIQRDLLVMVKNVEDLI